LTKGTRILKV